MQKTKQRFLIKFVSVTNWGSKRSIKNSWPHSELVRTAGHKSKSVSRSLETATFSPAADRRFAPMGRCLYKKLLDLFSPFANAS
jgi:hypothetical protein